MKIVIVGFGVVGKAMHRTFPNADAHDTGLGIVHQASGEYDIAFICVPTDMRNDGSAETEQVDAAIGEWVSRAKVIVIKSTVPPGYTETKLQRGLRVVMSPEFDGATQHSRSVDDDFVILGGYPDDAAIVAEAYKAVKPATFRILNTDPTTAELVKYGENAYLYNRVVFFHEFARICQAFGVNIDEWRELVTQDPRIDRAHSFVYRDHPWVSSHCLDKDVPAIIHASMGRGYYPMFLQSMVAVNAEWKEQGGRL